MAWITKRPCRIQRNGKMVAIPPGKFLPEAGNFKNPSMWCVWSPDETEATVVDEDKSKPSGEGDKPKDENSTEGNTSGEGSEKGEKSDTDTSNEPAVDYEKMTVETLRKLAREVQKKTQDFSTNIKKARKEELITIAKSLKKG